MKKLLAGGIVLSIALTALLSFSWLSNAEEESPPPAAPPAATGATELKEGLNFRPVVPPQPTNTGERIEVLEIFWYGCPHCNEFEPHLNAWLESAKPADVEFRRLPGVFRKSWIPAANAFYTAEALGVLEEMHPALFRAVHERSKSFHDEEDWAKFFSDLGVDEQEFRRTWNSLEVATKVRAAMTLSQGYGIEGVPAVVVGGKYQASSGMEGIADYDTLLKVANALIEKVRAEAQQQP